MKIKNYINIFISTIVFVAFVLLKLIAVNFAQQEIFNVFLNSGLMFVCWYLIRNSMAEQGLSTGEKDDKVYETKKVHFETALKIQSNVEKFNNWCAEKNKLALKESRIALLADYSLDYNLYFDSSGNFKDVEVPKPIETDNPKLNKKNKEVYKAKVKRLNKTRFLKVPPFIASEIMFRDSVITKGKRFGHSKTGWKRASIFTSVFVSLILIVALSFIQTSNKALQANEVMLLMFELLILLASGFMFYYMGYSFMLGEWREGLIQKTNTMNEFLQAVTSGIVIAELEPVPQQVKKMEEKQTETKEKEDG